MTRSDQLFRSDPTKGVDSDNINPSNEVFFVGDDGKLKRCLSSQIRQTAGSNVLWQKEIKAGEATNQIDVPAGVLSHKRLKIYLDIINDDASTATYYLYINGSTGLDTTDTNYRWQHEVDNNGANISAAEGDGPRIQLIDAGYGGHSTVDLTCLQEIVALVRSGKKAGSANLVNYDANIEYEGTLPDDIENVRFYANQASGFGVGTVITIIDPFAGGNMNPLAAPVRYSTNNNDGYGAGPTIINFEDEEYDDDDLVTVGASWKYTVPHDGTYRLTVAVMTDPAAVTDGELIYVDCYVNGTRSSRMCLDEVESTETRYFALTGSTEIQLSEDDELDFRLTQNTGLTLSLNADALVNWVTVSEVPTSMSILTEGWKSYTPTIYGWTGGFGTVVGRYKDLGNEVDCEVWIPVTGGITPTSTSLGVGIPSGFTIDPIASFSGSQMSFGDTVMRDVGSATSYMGHVTPYGTDTDRVLPVCLGAGTSYLTIASVQHDTPFTFANTDTIHIRFKVPVTRS